jgi:16S rRNA (adenine1518-N6/adenine1519-N6)-dimethyltransferase
MRETVEKFLKDNNFNPSKKMGQNFLINKNICEELVNSIDFSKVDLIIEIGPGLGAITQFLVNKTKKMIAIELDKRLAEFITNKYPSIELINNDVLKVEFDKLIADYKNPIIVSNLPYSISSLIIHKFIKSDIKEMYCMLQKEMVDRLCAKPKTHEYNNLTVLLNSYTNITKIMNIGKNNFLPPPNVDSIFIKIEKNSEIYNEQYDKFLRQSFSSKRQTLANNLKTIIQKQDLYKYLLECGFSSTIRAEEITANDFKKLFIFLKK